MVRSFENKNYWAIILGGSTGLGLASAIKLAEEGMNIIIIHRDRKTNMPKIEESFQHIKASGVACLNFNIDAVNPQKRAETIEHIKKNLGSTGKVRTLVHSIAKGNLKPMLGKEHSLKNPDFLLTIEAMALSLYHWVKELFSADVFAKDARIISFTSAGNKKPWQGYAAVSAAKVTLEAITRNIALEFAAYGIRANCLQPGTVDTASFKAIPGSEQIRERALKSNPYKRLTTPQDVANVVFLLSKDEAAWINGTIIPVDGGEHLF